jgi:hypothetical protein
MAEVISTVGVTLLLVAYWAERRDRIGERLYLALNFVGATLAAIGSLLIPFVPFVVLESSWAAIALRDLLRTRQPGG